MTGPALNNNNFSNNGNNLRPFKPFGLNVKVPERTIQQIGSTIKDTASSGVNSVLGYLAENENVFNGQVAKEIDNLFIQGFNTNQILKDAEAEPKHKFEMHM